MILLKATILVMSKIIRSWSMMAIRGSVSGEIISIITVYFIRLHDRVKKYEEIQLRDLIYDYLYY